MNSLVTHDPKILALDATGPTPSVYLGSEMQGWQGDLQGQTLASGFIPMLSELLAQARWHKNDLDVLAVTLGPGPFTAVRVAVSLIKGLAVALDRPVVALTGFELLAWNQQAAKILTLIDAQRGEFYGQLWQHDTRHQPCSLAPARLASAKDWLQSLRGESQVVIVAHGGEMVCEKMGWTGELVSLSASPAKLLSQVARQDYRHHKILRPRELKVFYLRPPDAVARRAVTGLPQ